LFQLTEIGTKADAAMTASIALHTRQPSPSEKTMNKNRRSSQFLFILSVFMAMLLSGCGGGGQSEQTAGSGSPSVRSFAADPAPQITLTSSSISKTTVASGETQTVHATIKSNIAAQNL